MVAWGEFIYVFCFLPHKINRFVLRVQWIKQLNILLLACT